MTRAVRRLLPALVLLAAAGCARNPVTGRPEVVLVSPRAEEQAGAEQAAEIARTMGLVEAPALVAWVEAVGARLAAHAPGGYRYRFQIADAPEPNAFALPGGWIYVSRGLLALLNSEDEVACVLGHEIAHVAARHAARRISRAVPLAVVTGVPAAATAIVAPRLGEAMARAGGLVTEAVLAPYSREQEREADRVGQELAAAAGWDPAALGRILETMERDERLAGGGGAPRFFATHPSTADRARTVTARAAELAVAPEPPVVGGRAALLARLDGVVLGGAAADGVVDGRRFLHPDLDFAIDFPPGWTIANPRTSVVGGAPDERALVVIARTGRGGDPVAAAHGFEEASEVRLDEIRPLRVGGLAAAHAETVVSTRDGRAVLDLTWIAHRGNVLEILGLAAPRDYERQRSAITATARSFRPLTARERGSFEETRLRSATARPGESLAAFAGRTGSRWSPVQIAIANGLPDDATPAAATLLKIARRERYRPQPAR